MPFASFKWILFLNPWKTFLTCLFSKNLKDFLGWEDSVRTPSTLNMMAFISWVLPSSLYPHVFTKLQFLLNMRKINKFCPFHCLSGASLFPLFPSSLDSILSGQDNCNLLFVPLHPDFLLSIQLPNYQLSNLSKIHVVGQLSP